MDDVTALTAEAFDWNKVGPELEALGQAIADTIDPSNPMQSNESTMDCLEHLWSLGYRVVPHAAALPAPEPRVERIRREQAAQPDRPTVPPAASGGGPITAVMVSRLDDAPEEPRAGQYLVGQAPGVWVLDRHRRLSPCAPRPAGAGAAPVEERCAFEHPWGTCGGERGFWRHDTTTAEREPSLFHTFTPAPRSAGAGDGRTDR